MRITADFAAAANGKRFPKSMGTLLLNPCFHAVALFRLSSLLYRAHLETLIGKDLSLVSRGGAMGNARTANIGVHSGI